MTLTTSLRPARSARLPISRKLRVAFQTLVMFSTGLHYRLSIQDAAVSDISAELEHYLLFSLLQ